MSTITTKIKSELELPLEAKEKISNLMIFSEQALKKASYAMATCTRIAVPSGGLTALTFGSGVFSPLAFIFAIITAICIIVGTIAFIVSIIIYIQQKINRIYTSKTLAEEIIKNKDNIDEVLLYVNSTYDIVCAVLKSTGVVSTPLKPLLVIPKLCLSTVKENLVKNAKRLNDPKLKEITTELPNKNLMTNIKDKDFEELREILIKQIQQNNLK